MNGIFIIAHAPLAQALRQCALHVFPDCADNVVALDVLPQEPPDLSSPLIKAWHDEETWLRHRLLLTPHSAFYTPESARDMRSIAARTAARYLRDGRLENCVNERFLTHRR
jgi:phosphoglycerate dehydrogenase-like enzyme